ncbi:MAG: hypothetical protein V3T17_02760 [Pseudomonadales bacterium]
MKVIVAGKPKTLAAIITEMAPLTHFTQDEQRTNLHHTNKQTQRIEG